MKHWFFSWHFLATITATVFFSYVGMLLLSQVVDAFTSTPFGMSAGAGHQSFFSSSQIVATPPIATASVAPNTFFKVPHITFVGDIMLARSVELWMQGEGQGYPFLHLPEIIGSSTAVLANFEAAIPFSHEHTRAYSTRFSADAKYVSALAESGVTHVSLANNHAYDFDTAGVENTRRVLLENTVTPFGDANTLGTTSVTYLTLGTTTISILALQTVYGAIDLVRLAPLIASMKKSSDVQIAYVHWGTEYVPTHMAEEEKLAHTLAAFGIDAIIGHHPHVVEDIQMVAGIPVFYSLGNFIFDQYFSTAVQQGLTLQLQIVANQLVFTLVPVTSLGTHAQPRVMKASEREVFLKKLADRSDPSLSPAIIAGKMSVTINLQNLKK